MAAHTMFDGRLQIYKRGHVWSCAARVGGQRFRSTTAEESLDRAKDIAEEWYLTLRGKLREGKIVPKERTFGEAAHDYLREMRVLAASSRSPTYVSNLELRAKANVLPYFKDKPLSSVNKGLVQSYRVHRAETTMEKTAIRDADGKITSPGKTPARSTMLQEIVIIRQILKHAEGKGWIPFVPNLSTAYMTQKKKGRRAWFDPDEYKQLYRATRRRITEGKRRGWKPRYQDLHDFVLVMANTGLRPDEAWNLEFRDVKIEDDFATKTTILVIDVRGKTGTGFCKSMPNAVFPFEELRSRRLQPLLAAGNSEAEALRLIQNTKVFPDRNTEVLNQILEEEELKLDRDGQRRTAYSLRHTYISMRLMEGANIYQVANNCRTSVEMIQEHYANHIKNRLDAAAINVQRPRAARDAEKRQRKLSSPLQRQGEPQS
jgi:integrase